MMQVANSRLKEASEARELRMATEALQVRVNPNPNPNPNPYPNPTPTPHQARVQAADAREVSLRRALRRRHTQLRYAREELAELRALSGSPGRHLPDISPISRRCCSRTTAWPRSQTSASRASSSRTSRTLTLRLAP